MEKYIRVGSVDAELIPVSDVYNFTYDGGTGKEVLRLYVDSLIKSFDELYLLFNGEEDKTIYEYSDIIDDESGETVCSQTNVYTHYCVNYSCCYNGGENHLDYPTNFYIELTRKTKEQIATELSGVELNDASLALTSLYETL